MIVGIQCIDWGKWGNKSFINKNFTTNWVVDSNYFNFIYEMRFPQLRGNC